MKTERQIWKRSRHWLLATGLLFSSGSILTSCSDYDLDDRTPEGWGASIYSWLDEQGNYTNTVRLINELGYREVLAKTGSKTLFVADDEAYQRFYQNNTWGVHSYEQLSESQKKLLLRGSMIDNSMQLHNLSSVEGNPPREGEAMRRLASSSPFDSVTVMKPVDMPDNPYWKWYRDNGKTIVCMTDNSTTTLLQFIEKQLVNKKITNADYDFLYNGKTQRKPGDASINGVQVAEANIKCSNGFIHRMAEVVAPLPNMAELIRQKPVASQFNKLLERFCAPYPCDEATRTQYNYLYGADVDTVFQKRFFSEKSQGGIAVNMTPRRGTVPGKLKFDPEWNAYYAGLNDQGGNIALQRDMAVMMVPSNQALDEYWTSGAGKALRDNYGTWESVPDNVIEELINNNMLSSFVSSVPSKFDGILNDANDPMGVVPEAIDSVWLGCNGAVYLTNHVYSPTRYVSVLAPALFNETMSIINWAVDKSTLQYDVYLNSLNAYYSFFIPSNKGLLEYIDPCSYGKSMTQLFRFHYDDSKVNWNDKVWASIWNYDVLTGEVGDSIGLADNYQIRNRLKDILETHIVIGNVEDGHEYYRTKGGTEIRVKNANLGAGGMTVEGSYQVNEGEPLHVNYIYDQTDGGNGKCYILDNQPILGTRITVDSILGQHPEFARFRELMQTGDSILEQVHNERNATAGTNVRSFNTYHYTVYVPTNESIEALQKQGKLPTVDQVANLEDANDTEGALQLKRKIADFVKYHIQDNALFIGAERDTADFETAVIDPKTKRFYRLTATLSDTGIDLEDQACKKDPTRQHPHVVTTDPRLFNLMAREFQYNSKLARDAANIETSSSAVIHLIDKPLLLDN